MKLFRHTEAGEIDTLFTWPYSDSPYTIEGGTVGQRNNGKVEIVLSAENNWTATIQGLESGDASDPWKYYVEETLSGYTANITDGVINSGTINITNTKDVAETSVAVQKLWDVESESLKSDVTVKLMQVKGIPQGNTVSVKLGLPRHYTAWIDGEDKNINDIVYSGTTTEIVGDGSVTISYESWNKLHSNVLIDGVKATEGTEYDYRANNGKQIITLNNVTSNKNIVLMWYAVNYNAPAPMYTVSISGVAATVTPTSDPAVQYGSSRTLKADKNWYDVWETLPASDTIDGTTYVYSYYVVEDSVPDGFSVSYSVDNGNTWKDALSSDDAVTGGKTFQVKNTETNDYGNGPDIYL